MSDPRYQLQADLAERYLLERELGRGGMATVYLAQDLRHDRSVALKVLRPELTASLGAERFLREIKLAARLQHPHILTVHDSGETAGQLWYTMPFVDGESLRDRLRRERQLSLDDAIRITGEVGDALGYAHSQGVVHRDIKPENILLSRGHALVGDFGVARALQNAGGDQLTHTGTSVGTPAYMSPEQSMADPMLDGRSDQYSLGSVVYEMLTGEPPYTGPSAQVITAKRLMDPVPSARRLRETVPPALDDVLQRALAKAPADRFPTAEAFVQAISDAISSASRLPVVVAERHEPGSTALMNPRWRRAGLAGVGLIGVVLAGVLWAGAHRRGVVSLASDSGPKRLAVLPFENLGDSTDGYFADGVTDEVRGKLAALPGIEVIARASSTQYRATTKPPSRVGQELGAAYLLTGTVRWEKHPGGRSVVRVSPELVDAQSGATRWQEPFDAALTDVFQVQADIAAKVARALRLRLTPTAERNLAYAPTDNLDAYDSYLRGTELERMGSDPSGERALVAFAAAVRRDSTFALAWAALAAARGRRFLAARDPAEAEAMRQATQRALALAPDLPEAHARLGEYQTWVRHDNAAALKAYETGLRLAPNDPLLLGRVGFVEMRLGRWDAAVSHLLQASKLDPRSGVRFANLRMAYWYLRQYREAREAAERTAALAPASADAFAARVRIALSEGNLPAARALLRRVPHEVDEGAVLTDMPTWALDTERLRLLASTSLAQFGGNGARRSLVLSRCYLRLGDSLTARIYADSARAAYEQALARSQDDPELHSEAGLAFAYLGQREAAVREGQRAIALVPTASDAIAGPTYQARLVWIYLFVGELNSALDQLEPLLKIAGWLSPGWLKLDPAFDQLRGNPRFERLVNGT